MEICKVITAKTILYLLFRILKAHFSPFRGNFLHVLGVHFINLVENRNSGWLWWCFSPFCRMLVLSENFRGKTIKEISQWVDKGCRFIKVFSHKILVYYSVKGKRFKHAWKERLILNWNLHTPRHSTPLASVSGSSIITALQRRTNSTCHPISTVRCKTTSVWSNCQIKVS